MSMKLMQIMFSSLRQARFVPLGVLTANTALLAGLLTPAAFAGQLPNGKFAFDYAPRLVAAATTQQAAFVSGGTYTFTLTVPQDAGAPLQAVTISQVPNARKIEFQVSQTQAIANGALVPLTSIGGDSSDDVTIAFEQPIQPGATVTISLPVGQNPGADGVYLFGVTAYPVGEQSRGLFLGYGRVSLLSNGG